MKHLKLFNNDNQFNNWITSNDYIIPNIVKLKNDKYIDYKANLNYNYVDLDLPSGILWATKNIGAKNITDFGLYFAWGETKGYYWPNNEKSFSWSDYKFSLDDSGNNITKYNSSTYKNLEIIDDAAHVYMGNGWCIPNDLHYQELLDIRYTTKEYISNYNNSGINGLLITSINNGNTIFFPFGCCITDGDVTNKIVNPAGVYWAAPGKGKDASTLYTDNWSGSLRTFHGNSRNRYVGCNIRAIKVSN